MTTQYILRRQSNWPDTYGVGEIIADNVVLFRAGHYDLSKEEAEALLRKESRGQVK